METETSVPPGFRFHPTEEELVGYYLTRKVSSQRIDLQVITEVDLYGIEPWELQERCKHGYEEQKEWYFFSHKDRKYPSGSRTNRATAAGFWKATGRDKAVVSRSKVIGMRKTLVFYEGRAPNGRKTDWIMHEYRLPSTEQRPCKAKGWVVCRAFKKQSTSPSPCFPGCYLAGHGRCQVVARAMEETAQGASFIGCVDGVESNESYNGLLEIPWLESPGEGNETLLLDWKTMDTFAGVDYGLLNHHNPGDEFELSALH
ncbi:hypothetical protein HPP92_009263 [Vanilla planifolia]|uniref:NAC domain-containing protein n=1 Tax=Vanilla planifolia TaxID=51239 RepID=A0A835V2P6_VANPL|nr:hypothetical protein HPP92_009263 [Vanilla planifolia]